MATRFWKNCTGNVAVIYALSVIPILAASVGAIDLFSINRKADELQNKLDLSALEISTKYFSGMSQNELEELGRNIFMAHFDNITDAEKADYEYKDGLFDSFGAKVEPEGPDSYVTVQSAAFHEGMLGWSMDWVARRKSVVRIRPGDPACVLALDRNASQAIKIQGSSHVRMDGCVMASNSRSASAIYRGGSAKLTVDCVTTVGGTVGLTSDSNSVLDCDAPREYQYPSLDPLFGTELPTTTACGRLSGGKTKTLSPGTYCGERISGDVTLEPGTYILRGGEVALGGNGRLVGHGVTIFLLENAKFSISANQTVQLSPPTSGPYAGITLFQPTSNVSPLTINGGVDSLVTGFIYAPGAHVFMAGNSTTTGSGDCIRIVGNTIEMTGNSDIAADCTDELGGRKMYGSRHISLFR
ncbi:MAG: pilus assembly protein [Rhizobiaceae bacterium]|nr:pilus assembly protein [Rhizobiaceae bacterium]MCV0406151.1 pilus assembly protein [Rhizobiaceae bacterium]